MQRYVVVGGGLAGLTAANALAGGGHDVVVFEQSEGLGGRATTRIERGYHLNLGPHALHHSGVAARTLREWGVPFDGHPPDASADSYLVRGERTSPLVYTARGLLTTRLFSAREKLQTLQILRHLSTGGVAQGETMREWIDRRARSQAVREFASMLLRISTYSADLSKLSARAALAHFRSALNPGVLYLDGGWQTLIDGLEQRARRLGVDIRLGEPVKDLASIDADGVVLAIPPAAVERLSGFALPPMSAVRVACLDLGLRAMPRGAARIALGMDQPLYLSAHSAVARLAPAGGVVAHLCKYLERPGDAASDRRDLEAFADLAMPGWRAEAEIVRFLPNMTVTPAVYSPEGRPAVEALAIGGVAVAGDWVGDEAMLADAAAASALRAAAVIQRQRRRAA